MIERVPRLSAAKLTWLTSRPYLAWFLLGVVVACATMAVLRRVETPVSVQNLPLVSPIAQAARSALPFIEWHANDPRTQGAMTAVALLLAAHGIGYIVLFKPALVRARRLVRENETEALDGTLPFALAVVLIGVIVLGMLLHDSDAGFFYRTDSGYFRPEGWIVLIDPLMRWTVLLAVFLGAVPWLFLMFTATLTATGSSGGRDADTGTKP